MAGAFYATNVGATRPMGMEGWRFAFLLVSWLCCCTDPAVETYRTAILPSAS